MKTRILLFAFLANIIISCSGADSNDEEVQGKRVSVQKEILEQENYDLSISITNPIYKSFRAKITNNTDSIIYLDFDNSTFVNQHNEVFQILSGATTWAKKEELSQRIIIIPPKTNLFRCIYSERESLLEWERV